MNLKPLGHVVRDARGYGCIDPTRSAIGALRKHFRDFPDTDKACLVNVFIDDEGKTHMQDAAIFNRADINHG
jgi:hypothetical protein